ncbi:MAG: ERAP1-like C-terminal domain-containing protein [Deltaproteobacteria bacterium]|nr:ERAP1-like C-terminal domain-containing protein [Deltaproteobacteria bacterium]
MPAAGYKINADHTGFYRVRYLNTEDLEILGKRVRDKSLSTEDRWGLQSDLYAMVRSGNDGIHRDSLRLSRSITEAEDAFLPDVQHRGQSVLSLQSPELVQAKTG